MSEQLIIRLGSSPEEPVWWLVYAATTDEVIASGQLHDARELAELASRIGTSRPVIGLVPACDVAFKVVPLPSKPTRQLLQALPYMLEEDVSEDIDQLLVLPHQTLQVDEQHQIQVAVLRRSILVEWVALLQQVGFNVRRLLPDALCLPLVSQAVAVQLGDQWLVRQGPWQASCIDACWWEDYLLLAASGEVLSYSPWPAALASTPHQLAPAELPLQLLARGLNQHEFNLLQGEFAPRRPTNKYWQQWKLSASLAFVTLAAYLGLVMLEGWQAEHAAVQARSQTQQLYKQKFPQERIVNLKRQVERKLAASGGNPDASLVGLLAQLQPHLSSIESMHLDNLKFDAKKAELKFQATAGGFADFEQLRSKLEAQGFAVEQGALSQIEGKVQGTFGMKRK